MQNVSIDEMGTQWLWKFYWKFVCNVSLNKIRDLQIFDNLFMNTCVPFYTG